jgi:hypothetical protein
VTLGDVDFRKSPMKIVYREFPKTPSLPVTCHSVSPAIGVNIAAKDVMSEINLTKHFVAREGSQSERAPTPSEFFEEDADQRIVDVLIKARSRVFPWFYHSSTDAIFRFGTS